MTSILDASIVIPSQRPQSQKGVALAVALIILVVITIMALSANRFTVLEVRQATNFETVRDAQQAAQSVVDSLGSMPANTPVFGGIGYAICTNSPGHTTGCDKTNAAMGGAIFSNEIAAGQVSGRAVRQGPLLGPPPRGLGASLTKFSAARFAVQGRYDRTADRLSRAEVDEGIIVLVPRY